MTSDPIQPCRISGGRHQHIRAQRSFRAAQQQQQQQQQQPAADIVPQPPPPLPTNKTHAESKGGIGHVTRGRPKRITVAKGVNVIPHTVVEYHSTDRMHPLPHISHHLISNISNHRGPTCEVSHCALVIFPDHPSPHPTQHQAYLSPCKFLASLSLPPSFFLALSFSVYNQHPTPNTQHPTPNTQHPTPYTQYARVLLLFKVSPLTHP